MSNILSARTRCYIALHQKCYIKTANINIKTYQFKIRVKDNQIIVKTANIQVFSDQKNSAPRSAWYIASSGAK
jgi:hypothetical protein